MAVPPTPTAGATRKGAMVAFPDKKTIRREARAARDAFADTNPIALSPPPALTDRFAPGIVVAAYRPVGGEADPAPLITAARAAGATIALPHIVDRATPMRFLLWAEGEPLVEGPFGLHQPAADAAEATPDIILAPLVAYDGALHRLGQGGGHYDRAFAHYPDAWRVGVAWSAQEVPAVPTDPWDVPLHALLTERGFVQRGDA